MADTLERISPLQPWAKRFAQLPDAVTIVEEPFITMVELRVDPSGPGAAAVASLLGVELPTTPSTYAKSGDTVVIWLGPRWLTGTRYRAGAGTAARGRRPARRRRGGRASAAHHAAIARVA
jgi:sarcosine oxidase subunit gamma